MKNIKFISCAILVFFTICFLSISAFALSGTGAEADPYLVSTPSDITLMHNDLDGYYKLTADIDMAGVDFEPIGNESEGAFTGTIDGDGHTISNLDINLPGNKYVGFIGYLEGTVKHLNLENVDACGYMYVGGISGFSTDNSNIESCFANGNVYGIGLINSLFVGGISGYNNGTMNDCENTGKISGKTNSGYSTSAGGIVGYSNGNVLNCKNQGAVSSYANNSSGESFAGGIVGRNYSTIDNCSNNGIVGFSYAYGHAYAGGIAGENNKIITSCLNRGLFSLPSHDGGWSCVGGITGMNNKSIENCLNFGDISCIWEEVGGITGRNYSKVSKCSNYGNITSMKYSYSESGGISGSNYGIIEFCLNGGIILAMPNGDYYSHAAFAGGIAGESNGTIGNCRNFSMVASIFDYDGSTSSTVNTYSGGIVGRNSGVANDCSSLGIIFSNSKRSGNYAGGVASTNSKNVLNCTSNSVIYANSGNGIVWQNTGSLNSCFNLEELSVSENQLNFKEFSNATFFQNYDFIYTWYIDPNTNSGFPQLRNMPRHINLNECVLLLNVGESDKLEAFVDGVPESVTWSSEDENIATVSADGTVTAISTGDIMISATNDEGMKMNCLVHITKDVSDITLSESKIQLDTNTNTTLSYTLNPVDANEAVTWTSSDESIVTVNQKGLVQPIRKGIATITVTTVTSGYAASCEVTVVGKPITNVSIPGSATINKGTLYKLSLTVSPTQYEGTVTWSSSDESVATVSQDGTVTGHKAGSAVITVKSDTGKTATCTVTVKIPSTEFTLNKTELTIEKGFTEKLIPVLTPEDTTDTISWSSSSTSYVTVASDGTITAKATGSATITATTTSGLKAYCFVKVIAAKVPVSSVTLGNTELIMTKADTKQLTATILPTNATDTSLTWTTSNEEVATVSNTGVVTAVGDGVAIITATSNNGMYHECVVKVISASGPSVVLEDAKASPGGKAVVKANIVKNPGISAYKFTVNYDRTKLTPVDISANAEFGGTFTTNLEDAERAGLNVLWHSTNDVNINGELFTVEFDISDSAQYGDSTEIYVTYGGTDICNTNGDYIALYTDGAVVNIKEPTPGDVYEDEDVNVYDLTLIARYITFLEDFTARQQEAGDVNNDLIVDIKDVVKLSQYLVGWSGATLMSETATLMNDENPEIVVGTSSVNANCEVVIPVSIKNNPGITGLNYKIDYSTDELEILSITPNTELLASNFITNLGYEDERGLAVTWHQNDNMTSDGVLFTISAKLKDGVDVGTITIIPADNNMCNQNGENVVATYADGYILAQRYIVDEQSVSDSAFTCNMYFDKTFTEQSATAIVAFYNGTKFVKMAFAPITVKEGKVDVTIPCDKVSYASYKVFVWKDLVSMKPLVEAKQN